MSKLPKAVRVSEFSGDETARILADEMARRHGLPDGDYGVAWVAHPDGRLTVLASPEHNAAELCGLLNRRGNMPGALEIAVVVLLGVSTALVAWGLAGVVWGLA